MVILKEKNKDVNESLFEKWFFRFLCVFICCCMFALGYIFCYKNGLAEDLNSVHPSAKIYDGIYCPVKIHEDLETEYSC